MVSLIESGEIQRQLARQAMEEEMKIQKGERVLVGVNRFVVDEEDQEDELVFHEPDPLMREHQLQRLGDVKRKRDSGQVARALDRLAGAIRRNENLMPRS